MGYVIEQADLARDRDAIVAFWAEHFQGWSPAKLPWLYEHNHHGRSTCFLARTEAGGDVVGVNAVFPRRVLVDGALHIAAIAGDLGVAPAHRGKGGTAPLMAVTGDEAAARGWRFMYGSPNVVSEKVCARIGYERVGLIKRMVRVLRFGPYLQRWVRSRVVARVLAAPLDACWRRLQRCPATVRQRFAGAEVADVDERFDALFAAAVAGHPVLGERTAAALRWRYRDCPLHDYRIFTLVDRDDDSLAGYAVYYLTGGNAQIADILVRDPAVHLPTLVALLVDHLHDDPQLSRVTFYYMGLPAYAAAFRRQGFSERADQRSVIVRVAADSPLAGTLKDPDRWHFLEGDIDV